MILKQGSTGPEVWGLQHALSDLGYYKGVVDGDYGPKTRAAVLAFQLEYEALVDTGVADPETLGKLAQASHKDHDVVPAEAAIKCDDETWTAWRKLVDLITGAPVRYGPGRGLFVGGKFVVTRGPGSLKADGWKSPLGHTYPSFHCTSWTNFALSWLLRRNADYTHAGNIPDLFVMLAQEPTVHQVPNAGPYRGFKGSVTEIASNGSSSKRIRGGGRQYIDAREILARRAELPTFLVFGQSTLIAGTTKWWHHTGMYVVDHRDGDRLYRIAADGYYGASGWSGQAMHYTEITDQNVSALDAAFYRLYGVNERVDGSYGDATRPIADVVLEQ